MSFLDHLADSEKRRFWVGILVWKGTAFVAYIITAYVLIGWNKGWLSSFWHLADQWQVVAIIVSLLVCGVLIIFSGFRRSYSAAEFSPEEVNAKIQELKKDWEQDKKDWELNRKELEESYIKRLSDLELNIQRVLARPRLIVVSWPGYTVEKIIEGFPDIKISSITYVRGIDRATRFSLDAELPDVLIVDNELQELATENEPLLRLDSELELSQSLRTVNQAVMALEEIDPAHFLPLRLGLNALAYSKVLWGKRAPVGYDALFTRDKCPQVASGDSIGIWNWYLPSMLVLFLAIGKKPNDIVNLSFTDTQTLLEMLRQKLIESGFMARITSFYNQVDGLISDLEFGRVSLVPAGGGWTFRPFGRQGQQDLVGTVVPAEGALVWIEGAVVLRKHQAQHKHAVQFLKVLLEDETQRTLCLEGPYGGCAVNMNTIKELSKEEYLKRRSDCDNLFNDDFSSFESNIYVRKLPRQHKLWEAWWDRFVEECQTPPYNARIK